MIKLSKFFLYLVAGLGLLIDAQAQTITTTATTNPYTLHAPTIVVDDNVTISSPTSITNAKVTVSSNFNTGDMLSYTGSLPFGVTSSYNTTTGVLAFTGTATAAEWQALLRTVTFSSTSNVIADRGIVFSLQSLLAGTNGHFYEFVPNPDPANSIHWTDAKLAADTRFYNGLQGYLATITSQEENDIIAQKLTASGWIGSSDSFNLINTALGSATYANQAASEGNWYWVTGPEAGLKFRTQVWPNTISGVFSNWAAGEPNNFGTGEQFGEIYAGTLLGQWNDFFTNKNDVVYIGGYVVEYGGMPGDPVVTISASRTIVISSILPVQLISFNATIQNNCTGVILNWVTASEQNSKHSIVERSTNAQNWVTIATVAAAGNSSIIKTYNYTDGTVSNGTYFYRLRQQDIDGQEKLSSTVSVKLNCNKNNYYVYPNPVHDVLTIQVPAGSVRQVQVTNGMGQLIKNFSISSNTAQTLNASNWTKGLYYVVIIENGERVHVEKIIKQ